MRKLTLLSLTFALTACAATDFWSAALMLALLLPACFQPTDEGGSTGGGGATAGGGGTAGGKSGTGGGNPGTSGGRTGTAGGSNPGTAGGSGNWEQCCLQPNPDGGRVGIISTCFCPATAACNYGWFVRCADGCVNYGIPLTDGGYCP